MHGGMGTGFYSQGQPVLERLVKRLAAYYRIDVYMQLPPDPGFVPDGFGLFSPGADIKWGIRRWVHLYFLLLANHRKEKYHLFYSFWGYPAGLLTVLLGKFFRRPSVIHLQGGDAAYIPSLDYGVFCHPLRRILCVWAYSQCNVLIALTDYQVKFLRQFGISRTIQVIPFGVDTEMFGYQPKRKHSDVIHCLHVGNQTPVKDQATLLNAFALLALRVPATLTVVGADHDNGRLTNLCHALGIADKVTFLGPQPYKNLPKYYHESDVLLLTSLYEGQGLVLTEAASCGTLLAGTSVGILADMGENCGIITPVKEPEMLSKGILRVWESPARMNELKTAARKWALEKNEDYTVRRIAEELKKLILES